MAFLVKRPGGRIEIRESRTTARGPRSRQLARFSGALTPDVLAVAEDRATGPFHRERLIERALQLGIRVEDRAPESEARALLTRLRRADPIDPRLAGILTRALADVATEAIPESLEDVSEWIGASAAERGAALRDLLDAFGRIAESRPARRTREKAAFPRFSSERPAIAS